MKAYVQVIFTDVSKEQNISFFSVFEYRTIRLPRICMNLKVFRLEATGNCVPLVCYSTSSGNIFADVSGRPIGNIFKFQGNRISFLMIVPIGCPETSIKNCHSLLRNDPEECSSPFPLSWICSCDALSLRQRGVTTLRVVIL